MLSKHHNAPGILHDEGSGEGRMNKEDLDFKTTYTATVRGKLANLTQIGEQYMAQLEFRDENGNLLSWSTVPIGSLDKAE